MNIPEKNFQKTLNGKEIKLFTLTLDGDTKIVLTNYGGRIVSWLTPDRQGSLADIVLGFDSIDKYIEASDQYYGAIIGRYSNRISDGTFVLNEKQYYLSNGKDGNHLHGGPGGFHTKIWEAYQCGNNKVVLKYVSENGEEGYPGRLEVYIEYKLTNEQELTIEYTAKTDRPTIISLTNHTFFNLSGRAGSTIDNHKLMINADRYTPITDTLIPTGEITDVANTPFDFRQSKAIGKDLDQINDQLLYGSGYDHNFVLNKTSEHRLHKAARVEEPKSGRYLELSTTEPGLQFYSGNYLDGSDIGKEGVPYYCRTGFCLEPHHFPDSPNHATFPSVVLEPDSTYNSRSIYRMGVFN
ncbi:aldose epimerase family protein [Fodinibius saliphilus]|uniref:aldose epimerase family protein n=1 Tax=Fodinibius saliphilus TaxID=1920650 RepID=UPI0014873478|nr:aldose epimerase family protein [Fodinibius saliphilus]